MPTLARFKPFAGKLVGVSSEDSTIWGTFLLRRLRVSIMAGFSHSVTTSRSKASDAWSRPLHFLDGKRVQATNPKSSHNINVIEPATGAVLTTLRSANQEDVDKAVSSAKVALAKWTQLSGLERGKKLRKASELLRERIEEVAVVEVHDNGKPIWEARLDVEGCADTLEYYAGLAATVTGEYLPLSNGNFVYTRREPLGVVGAIGAWNYPSQMVIWKSAPALACGNAMVFKPSPLTPLSAVVLAEIYVQAGIPDGLFNIIQGGAETGQILSHHPGISKMSFTGSVPSGSKVMESCARNIKQVTLELGGKSPLIIFEDADIENAVKGTMMANFLTQGQVCSNGTRVFVHEKIWDVFVKKLVARTKAMKIGNPFSDDTTVGATISREQFEKVLQYIDGAKKEGATVLCGGERVIPLEPSLAGGYYMSPCVMTDVQDDMTVAREEVFGSVACLFRFSSEEEVVARANNSEFGLAGGIFTRDLARAHRVAAALENGSLFINNYNVYAPGVSFGGYKKSGFGRENGPDAVHYYTQVKSVYVEAGDVWCPL